MDEIIEDEKYKFENNTCYLKNPDGSLEKIFTVIEMSQEEATQEFKEMQKKFSWL